MIVGMTGYDGLPIHTHMGFKSIGDQLDEKKFSCSYVATGASVHSKLYVWMRRGQPLEAWIGSANYTQNGFGIGGRDTVHFETMTQTSPTDALAYFDLIKPKTVRWDAENVHDHVAFYKQTDFGHAELARADDPTPVATQGLERKLLPLFIVRGSGAGTVHEKSGLNWGQRPGRDRNQAYIPVPSEVARSGFFPPRGVHFNLVTTDGKSMLMTVAQDGDKALESPQSNALIGKYFRERLGVGSGDRVFIDDLDRFGNRYVAIYKIDEGNYVLDYSPVTSSVQV